MSGLFPLRECQPGANSFIEQFFGDCIYTSKDAVGFLLGIAAILIWMMAQIPQFIANIQNQSAEALSVWFLLQWFGGDTLNLLGCLIQGQQLPTTTYLAMYFVLTDAAMLMQYVYYGALQKRKQHLHRRRSTDLPHEAAQKLLAPLLGDTPSAPTLHRHGLSTHSAHSHGEIHVVGSSSHVLGHSPQTSGPLYPHAGPPKMRHMVGAGGNPPGPPATSPPPPAPPPSSTLASRAQPPPPSSTLTPMAEPPTCIPPPPMTPPSETSPPGAPPPSAEGPPVPQRMKYTQRRKLATLLPPTLLLMGAVLIGATLALYPHASTATAPRRSTGSPVLLADLHSNIKVSASSPANLLTSASSDPLLPVTQILTPAASVTSDQAASDESDWGKMRVLAGTLCGYASSVLYVGSRASQIMKNHDRKSVEGLSIMMFMMALAANVCTGTAILLRISNLGQLWEQLPWVLGTYGTVAADVFIFYQAMVLYHKP